MFSSFVELADFEKLWLPVTAIGWSPNGSTTLTFEWIFACPTLCRNCWRVISGAVAPAEDGKGGEQPML